jgi:hypothetical protein
MVEMFETKDATKQFMKYTMEDKGYNGQSLIRLSFSLF